MQMIEEIMTRNVSSISPLESIRAAAQLMAETDAGSLPVCENKKLVGLITDRDIVVRGVLQGDRPDDIEVGRIMSTDVQTCFEDQSVEEVMQKMADSQIRRIPVLDHLSQELIGIVSLGDLAVEHSAQIDETMAQIALPSQSLQSDSMPASPS